MKASPHLAKTRRTLVILLISVQLGLLGAFFLKERVWFIRGTSMLPTFQDQSRLVLVWNGSTPSRGDIVLVDIVDPDGVLPLSIIKRVIGVPGDRVQIQAGGHSVSVNGKELVEPYVPAGMVYDVERDITLGADEYYIMGDNRRISLDSRALGPVKLSQVRHILWSYWNF